MRAVIGLKKDFTDANSHVPLRSTPPRAQREIPESKSDVPLTSTPPTVPGEILRSKAHVSPTEVHRVQSLLKSRRIGTTELREAENIMPGASDTILKIAAQLALGNNVRQPRFGVMGTLVKKLGLFGDDVAREYHKPSASPNTYNAPVQVFNGPVYFGGATNSFQQLMI